MGIEARVRDRLTPVLLRMRFSIRPVDDLVRLGSDYGGWWVPERVLRAGAIAYCAGVGEDATLDVALAERGFEVWSFDPTPRAITHMAGVGGGVSFRAVGWWDRQDTLRFYAPANAAHVSHSIDNLQRTEDYFDAEVTTVAAIAADLGHTEIDLIKMDIEGAEKAVLPHLIAHGPRPAVLCVEFDYPYSVGALFALVGSVLAAGYDLVRVEERTATFLRGGPHAA